MGGGVIKGQFYQLFYIRFYEATVEGRSLRSSAGAPEEEEEESGDEEAEEGKDYSWKKTIMIGPTYQASVPAGLCSYDDTPPYENEDKQLWDPTRLSEEVSREYLAKSAETQGASGALGVNGIPTGSHIRDDEQALLLLLQCGYNTEEALRRKRMNAVPPADTMSLWSEEECRAFETGLRVYGKDFHSIQNQKVGTDKESELNKSRLDSFSEEIADGTVAGLPPTPAERWTMKSNRTGGGRKEGKKQRTHSMRVEEKERKRKIKKQLCLEKDLELSIERLKYEDIKEELHFINKLVEIYETGKSKVVLAYKFVQIELFEFFIDGIVIKITMSPSHAHVLSNLLNRFLNNPDDISENSSMKVCNGYDDYFLTVKKAWSVASGEFIKISNKESRLFIKLPFNKEQISKLESHLTNFVEICGRGDIPSKMKDEKIKGDIGDTVSLEECGTTPAPPGFMEGCCWCRCKEMSNNCSCCKPGPWWSDLKHEFDRMGGTKSFFLDNLLDDEFFTAECSAL